METDSRPVGEIRAGSNPAARTQVRKNQTIRNSLTARISASHAGGRGSIPRCGTFTPRE